MTLLRDKVRRSSFWSRRKGEFEKKVEEEKRIYSVGTAPTLSISSSDIESTTIVSNGTSNRTRVRVFNVPSSSSTSGSTQSPHLASQSMSSASLFSPSLTFSADDESTVATANTTKYMLKQKQKRNKLGMSTFPVASSPETWTPETLYSSPDRSFTQQPLYINEDPPVTSLRVGGEWSPPVRTVAVDDEDHLNQSGLTSCVTSISEKAMLQVSAKAKQEIPKVKSAKTKLKSLFSRNPFKKTSGTPEGDDKTEDSSNDEHEHHVKRLFQCGTLMEDFSEARRRSVRFGLPPMPENRLLPQCTSDNPAPPVSLQHSSSNRRGKFLSQRFRKDRGVNKNTEEEDVDFTPGPAAPSPTDGLVRTNSFYEDDESDYDKLVFGNMIGSDHSVEVSIDTLPTVKTNNRNDDDSKSGQNVRWVWNHPDPKQSKDSKSLIDDFYDDDDQSILSHIPHTRSVRGADTTPSPGCRGGSRIDMELARQKSRQMFKKIEEHAACDWKGASLSEDDVFAARAACCRPFRSQQNESGDFSLKNEIGDIVKDFCFFFRSLGEDLQDLPRGQECTPVDEIKLKQQQPRRKSRRRQLGHRRAQVDKNAPQYCTDDSTSFETSSDEAYVSDISSLGARSLPRGTRPR